MCHRGLRKKKCRVMDGQRQGHRQPSEGRKGYSTGGQAARTGQGGRDTIMGMILDERSCCLLVHLMGSRVAFTALG